MDEKSVMIGVIVGVLSASPNPALPDGGASRYIGYLYLLPGALFTAVSSLVPVLIVCLLSFLIMRRSNGLGSG
ncbi:MULTISPECIES: hypothetical protein [Thermococcus]|uniref:hypothetical protein n=1 Tax=Thermococcus TaxID=2263 RepID=UPI00064EBE39|nr:MULTISPECIES: hypothetical protein [Thermococcus]NJE04153.1 hypothetical protein [Thermococcus sp. MV11]